MKVIQFLFELAWYGLPRIVEAILAALVGFIGLFWFTGWLMLAPVMVYVSYYEGEIPFWLAVLFIVFWVGPVVVWAGFWLYEKWLEFNERYEEDK